MSEISRFTEMKNEGWNFYAEQKNEYAQLDKAVKDAGDPDVNPNDTSSTSSN